LLAAVVVAVYLVMDLMALLVAVQVVCVQLLQQLVEVVL
jgi:hypothetical protein